ncbi:MAG TPA: hypothetical protein VGQ31_08155 [Candidatus Limnocylindrales bacterium]|nr:hypothetical protein [Candidatus Limnocylindrales bacterium]
MWSTIDRARRRLDRSAAGPAAAAPDSPLEPASDDAPSPAPPTLEDVVLVLGPAEIDRLRMALQRELADGVERPDTPARLEHALALLLAGRGAPGRARVLRRPAGVSTPESWEIQLEGVEHATGATVREAGRCGRFSA